MMSKIDVVLSKDEFRELITRGAVEADDGDVALKEEDWLPTVVDMEWIKNAR